MPDIDLTKVLSVDTPTEVVVTYGGVRITFPAATFEVTAVVEEGKTQFLYDGAIGVTDPDRVVGMMMVLDAAYKGDFVMTQAVVE